MSLNAILIGCRIIFWFGRYVFFQLSQGIWLILDLYPSILSLRFLRNPKAKIKEEINQELAKFIVITVKKCVCQNRRKFKT